MPKYQVSEAAAKRIAVKLSAHYRDTMAATSYSDVLAALRDEDIASPDRAAGEVHDILVNAGLYESAAIIGRAALREARDNRETLRALREGFSRLGLAFESDIKPECFKE